MAKLYGQLAGTPIQTLRSGVAVTSVPPRYKDSADTLLMRDYAVVNANVVGDQVSLGSFRSTAWLDPFFSVLYVDGLGATCTYSLGDATHPAGLRPAANFAASSATVVPLGVATQSPTLMGQPLWQRLGYAADVGGTIELLLTFGGVNPANGNVGWELWGAALMPAKLLGLLVGQPTQNLRATGSGFVSDLYKDGRDQVLVRDYVTTQGNLIGDQFSLATLKSTTFININQSRLWFDAFGAGVTLNIGDASFPAALQARSLAAAALGGLLFNAAGVVAGNAPARVLWQLLGYAADPARPIELLGTFGGANPGNASFGWQIVGRKP